jgi:hypothetical protein
MSYFRGSGLPKPGYDGRGSAFTADVRAYMDDLAKRREVKECEAVSDFYRRAGMRFSTLYTDVLGCARMAPAVFRRECGDYADQDLFERTSEIALAFAHGRVQPRALLDLLCEARLTVDLFASDLEYHASLEITVPQRSEKIYCCVYPLALIDIMHKNINQDGLVTGLSPVQRKMLLCMLNDEVTEHPHAPDFGPR